ncbi:type IV toxin-antitoxin system AbiEi family antitoxin domain-containing protein [Eubacteriales bacterium OttesenSCG-928-M02]|nr:type IV toxin-antitoxin system AbiEi family antitoxin domain-containing protein [Eubacteriales bacterium OttesenSCG-928-M02]
MLFQKHSYIMRTSELRAAKIYYEDIQRLLSEGAIEKVKRGYYLWSDQENASEIVMIKRLFPDAILCMYTALFHYGYSDRTPSEWHLAVDKNIAKYRIKIDYPFIKTYFFEPHVLDIGKTTDKIDGVNISIYDKDRTICDCLRYMNKMDKEIFNKAIQSYVNDPDKSIPNIMRYAKELRVQSKVKNLIGVWL